jgi:hypothetical protein
MNDKRVAHLLEQLRERTPEEVTLGVMALAPSLTPEMWRALELLRMERSSWSVALPSIPTRGTANAATIKRAVPKITIVSNTDH